MKLLRPFISAALAAMVLVPMAAQAATPMQGVPTEIRRGFFTETDFGAFFTLGGEGKSPSDAQAYFHLGIGYDLYAQGNHFVAVSGGVGMGTSAGSCYGIPMAGENGDICSSADGTTLSNNWSATMVEGSLLYGYQVVPRLMLTGRILGGMSWIQPQAFDSTESPVPLVGAGIGAEWATQFDHFSLGLDIAGRMFLGTDAMGVSIAPRIKYTF